MTASAPSPGVTRRPRVAAHRGASSTFPENTLAAFKGAIDAGADAIEFDVHATLDGELVVVRDYELARTTNGRGLVHERAWPNIRSLDAGTWFGSRFAGERVPRVKDVLSLPIGAFELEVKGLPTPALVDAVCQAIAASGRGGSVQVTGYDHLVVHEIKRRMPDLQAGYFAPTREPWMSDRLYRQVIERSATFGGFDVVHARLPHLRALDVGSLHSMGLLVHAGDVNGADQVLEAAALGADHFTTNDPAAALRLFGRASWNGMSATPGGRRPVPPTGDTVVP